jgi:hypothetical protein
MQAGYSEHHGQHIRYRDEQIEYISDWLVGGNYEWFGYTKQRVMEVVSQLEYIYMGIFDIPRFQILEKLNINTGLTNKTVIGISGLSGSGKDTIADYLVENYGYTKWSFAKILKMLCCYLFDWTEVQLNDATFKETNDPRHGITPRQALQRIGTDHFRKNLDNDLWLKLTLSQNIERMVIPDVRFFNETESIVNQNWPVWRIKRPMSAEILAHPKYLHASETELISYPRFTAIIQNDATVDVLYSKIRDLLKK